MKERKALPEKDLASTEAPPVTDAGLFENNFELPPLPAVASSVLSKIDSSHVGAGEVAELLLLLARRHIKH